MTDSGHRGGRHDAPVTTLYTFGYQGRSVEELSSEADRLGAYVIDIRFAPFSRNPTWSGETLKAQLPRYLWVKQWGNKNYKGGPVAIEDFDRGAARVASVMADGWALLLLCVCSDVAVCHRKVVADRISAEMGWRVEHLVVDRTTSPRPQSRMTRSMFDEF